MSAVRRIDKKAERKLRQDLIDLRGLNTQEANFLLKVAGDLAIKCTEWLNNICQCMDSHLKAGRSINPPSWGRHIVRQVSITRNEIRMEVEKFLRKIIGFCRGLSQAPDLGYFARRAQPGQPGFWATDPVPLPTEDTRQMYGLAVGALKILPKVAIG